MAGNPTAVTVAILGYLGAESLLAPDLDGVTGWAARRGPGFKNPEPGPFPRSLPPNPAGTFQCTGLSSDCAAFATGLAWM